MDMDEILSRFGALPGQVPDVEEEEPACHRLARPQFLENPELLAIYRRQGLPVDACVSSDVFVLEPVGCSNPAARHAVLFEPGSFSDPGLWLHAEEHTVKVAWKLDSFAAPLQLDIFELQAGGVEALSYRLPDAAGRVCFIARQETFAVRAQLHVQDGGRGSVFFGQRLFLS